MVKGFVHFFRCHTCVVSTYYMNTFFLQYFRKYSLPALFTCCSSASGKHQETSYFITSKQKKTVQTHFSYRQSSYKHSISRDSKLVSFGYHALVLIVSWQQCGTYIREPSFRRTTFDPSVWYHIHTKKRKPNTPRKKREN